MEEDFFASNMSVMIALAPCLEIADWPDLSYESYLETNHKLFPEFRVLLDDNYNVEGSKKLEALCRKSDAALCSMVRRNVEKNLKYGDARRAPTDLKSML